MSAIRWTAFDSPIGPLTVASSPKGLVEISFSGRRQIPAGAAEAPLPEVTDQLSAYFAGELRRFELALDLRGTPLESDRRSLPPGDRRRRLAHERRSVSPQLQLA